MSIMLFCLVHGNTFKYAFPVKIKKNETVGDLKKVIKMKKPNNFANIDADRLILWKVSIPFDLSNDKRNVLEIDSKVDIKTVLEGEELLPIDNIKEHFDKPTKKYIHIIIELPTFFESPYFSQDVINKINKMHNQLTQKAIDTISISKINSENYQNLQRHLNIKFENVTFNNIPTHSNVLPLAFKWKEKSELAHKDEYLKWLRKYIPLTNGYIWYDVGGNSDLLEIKKDPRLPFNIRGGTNVVIVKDCDVKIDMVPESIYAVLELKKKVERNHNKQVILKMIIADLITARDRAVFGILSDLIDEWRIFWLENENNKTIKGWKAPSRNIAVQVISMLLSKKGLKSFQDNLESTSPIIPAAKRVKFDILFQNKIIDEDDDIARMEDVYDVMSKKEIMHHKVGVASKIIKSIPFFSSMYI
ncbi:hypothetical protein Glove_402g59 [Diversispora epigaea]|uniref:Crinkler effector protein N-terminal domain-containing protein n=1 Tax=Diversispora epigaea TaxID=1348612 RepID=A0A397H034_9GLOM|nr:hypothetical protein Glove_402g59 [Diversispora epigaea]